MITKEHEDADVEKRVRAGIGISRHLHKTHVMCWRAYKEKKPSNGMLIVVRWHNTGIEYDFSQPFFYNENECVGYIGDDDQWTQLPACT